MEDIATYVAAGAAIVGLIWGIVKIVVKLTPTPKDDEFVAKADGIVNSTVDALDGDGKPTKP